MTHWFFSPHPDDAALSCGGQIAMLTRQGERVVVITVMAGDPPDEFQPTPFVEELWARWGLGRGKAATATRREEDQGAMNALGAEIQFLEWTDAIYRVDDWNGQPLYPDVNAIFGKIDSIDSAMRMENHLAAAISEVAFDDVIHFPLGVGGHVDHRIIGELALSTLIEVYLLQDHSEETDIDAPSLEAPAFYEEYPYSLQGGSAIEAALNQFKINEVWDRDRFSTVLHPVDDDALEAKIAAIACYKSQISSFWNSIDEMERSIREYTVQVGGEREWQLIPPEAT